MFSLKGGGKSGSGEGKKPFPSASVLHDVRGLPRILSQEGREAKEILDRVHSLFAPALGSENVEKLAKKLTKGQLEELAAEFAELFSAFHEAKQYSYLNDFFHFTGPDKGKVSEQLVTMAEAGVFKTSQIQEGVKLLGEREDFFNVINFFIIAAMSNLPRNVLWQPLLSDIMDYEPAAASEHLYGQKLEEYVKMWDVRVAMLEDADREIGIRKFLALSSGGKCSSGCREGRGFYTKENGDVYAPPYSAIYEKKEDNIGHYKVSLLHESGHHRWDTFEVNMHPDALDYKTLGVEYLGSGKKKGKQYHRLKYTNSEGEEVTADVTTYIEFLGVVKYPKLLKWLHNVADDRRIDTLNMLFFRGWKEDYQTDIDYVLQQRDKIDEGDSVSNVLEAVLQVGVCGKTNGEAAENVAKRLLEIRGILSEMEIRRDTNGTDSLNVAIRWYKALEADFDKWASKLEVLKEEDLPEMMRGSRTKQNPELVKRDPDKVVISKKRGRYGPKSWGTNPLSFLNIPGIESDEDDDHWSNGEPSDPWRSGKPSKSGNQDAKPEEGNPESASDEGKEGKEGKENPAEPKGGKQENEYSYDEHGESGRRIGSKLVTEHDLPLEIHIGAPPHLKRMVERQFKRYAPKQGEFVRGTASGEPDPELLNEWLERFDVGQIEEPRYYADIVYERAKTALSILVDYSGSMDGIIATACQGASVLATGGRILKIPQEVNAFTGGDIVDFYPLGIESDAILLPRIGMSATPLAGAIRHNTFRLLELKKKHRMRHGAQIIITDCEPNSSGAGIDPVFDTGKAVEESRKKGITTFGIIVVPYEGAKQSLEDAFAKVMGYGNYIVTADIESVPFKMLNFFKKLAKKR